MMSSPDAKSAHLLVSCRGSLVCLPPFSHSPLASPTQSRRTRTKKTRPPLDDAWSPLQTRRRATRGGCVVCPRVEHGATLASWVPTAQRGFSCLSNHLATKSDGRLRRASTCSRTCSELWPLLKKKRSFSSSAPQPSPGAPPLLPNTASCQALSAFGRVWPHLAASDLHFPFHFR